MDDNGKKIAADSVRVMEKLRLLAVFFEEELIYKIYVRTQVIHRLFESNGELDINKLALFHLQFTESIIELLKKIRTNNEKLVTSMEEEQEVNEELITNLASALRDEENFEYSRDAHTLAVNKSIFNLYQNLSDYSVDNPFPKDIDQFGKRFGVPFFYEVPALLLEELTSFDPDEIYRNGYGIIEKKLMGLECKHDFGNSFYGGVRVGGEMVEIYRLDAEDHYFIFHPQRHLFLSCSLEQLAGVPPLVQESKKSKIIHELTEKNNGLKKAMVATRTQLPDEVVKLLQEYLDKISGIDFLDLIDDYDIQANILKTMLNTEGM